MSSNKLIYLSVLATSFAISACSPLSPSVSKFASGAKSATSAISSTSHIDQIGSGDIDPNNSTVVMITPSVENDTGSVPLASRSSNSSQSLNGTQISELIQDLQTEINTETSNQIETEDDVDVILTVKSGLTSSQRKSISNNLRIRLTALHFGTAKQLRINIVGNEDSTTGAVESAKTLLLNNLIGSYIVFN